MRRPIITVKREWTNPIAHPMYGVLLSWQGSRDIEVTPYSEKDIKVFDPPRGDGVTRTATVVRSPEKSFKVVLAKYRLNLPIPDSWADRLERIIW